MSELLILAGSPRSGTSWLRSILSSHPDIFLLPEPDKAENPLSLFHGIPLIVPEDNNDPELSRRLLNAVNSLKNVFYNVYYLIQPFNYIYSVLKRNSRYYGFKTVRSSLRLNWMRKHLKNPKTIVIIRHPCGHVNSVIKTSKDNLEPMRLEKYLLAAIGKNKESESLHKKLAVLWKTQNEPLISGEHKNLKIIIYEELCRNTNEAVRDVLEFLGLKFTKSVERHIFMTQHPEVNSTLRSLSKDNYSVYRNSIEASEKWKELLTKEQQKDVLEAVKGSNLMKFWKKSKSLQNS